VNTRDTAVRVHGVRGVPKSNTVPVPALPVLEIPRVFPYPCGTLHKEVIVSSWLRFGRLNWGLVTPSHLCACPQCKPDALPCYLPDFLCLIYIHQLSTQTQYAAITWTFQQFVWMTLLVHLLAMDLASLLPISTSSCSLVHLLQPTAYLATIVIVATEPSHWSRTSDALGAWYMYQSMDLLLWNKWNMKQAKYK
jgi:hypothetical protein